MFISSGFLIAISVAVIWGASYFGQNLVAPLRPMTSLAMINRRKTWFEGLKETAAAFTGIVAHSVVVHEFAVETYSFPSLAAALVAAFLMWAFFTWSLQRWVRSMEKRDRIEGSWGSLITKTSENEPTAVSTFNIQQHEDRFSLEGVSFRCERDAQGQLLLTKEGQWQSFEVAYSNSMLLYRYQSQTHGTGLCVYSFTRSRPDDAPTGYTGMFYEQRSTNEFSVVGRRIGVGEKLDDLRRLEELAGETYRLLAPAAIVAHASIHVVMRPTEIFTGPAPGAGSGRTLDTGVLVTLTGNNQDRVLVSRNGKEIGYVASSDLHPVS
ncbi:MAG TPA: hypothetical protein VMM15_14800 [Bradyrhizobium sp.]|nr:hypothetical protein [Bradyrhizobium sp.]